jgi:hypothetical protein
MTKSIDKVNTNVAGLLRDERAAREGREAKLRGQVSQSVLKLHAANKVGPPPNASPPHYPSFRYPNS